MAIDRKVKMKIIGCLKFGAKVAHIANEFGVSEGTVRSIRNELKPVTRSAPAPKEEVANDDSDSIRASIPPEFISTVVKPLAINKDGDLYEPKDDEVFKHNAPVGGDDISDDDSDYIKDLMIGADKIIIYRKTPRRKTIKVTIEFEVERPR